MTNETRSVPNLSPQPLAVLSAARTPFVRAFDAFLDVPALELGTVAARGALERAGLKPSDIDETIFGNVAGPPDAANISRVIALAVGLPQRQSHTRSIATADRDSRPWSPPDTPWHLVAANWLSPVESNRCRTSR